MKLKPCPFCGITPDSVQEVSGLFRVMCGSNECILLRTAWHKRADGAAEMWNRRTPDPRVTALVDAARAVLDALTVHGQRSELPGRQ